MQGRAVSWRPWFRVSGVFLVLAGVFLPRGWYDQLPWGPELPPQPIRGVTLLQVALVLQGAVLLALSFRSRLAARLGPSALPGLASIPNEDPGTARRDAWLLAGITALGLLLRLHQISSDLWLDEIAPVMDYGALSPWQVIASYQRSSNHLLNTLLVKGAIALFGEREWAIRLPAVLLGSATVPAFYWVVRMAQPRRAALGASALLAVSYHHIFFSQNARGYAGYLLFALLSTGLLISGLREDRGRTWALYVLTVVLGFATQLLTTFVFAAHVLCGSLAALVVRARRDAPAPLIGRLTGVFGAVALLTFQLYATVIPQAYVVGRTTYVRPTAGFGPLSVDFLVELVRGVSAGFGTGILLGVLPFLLLGMLGFIQLFRRHWLLASALVLPELITAAYLVSRGYGASPRFFLLGLPLAIASAVQGIWTLTAVAARHSQNVAAHLPRLRVAVTVLLCGASALSLGSYYRLPKQDYRGAVQYIEASRRPEDAVVVFGIAEKGFRFYATREAVPPGRDYRYSRDAAELDSILAAHPSRRVFVAVTFARELRTAYPALFSRIRGDWPAPRVFEGTVGDGAVLVFTVPGTAPPR